MSQKINGMMEDTQGRFVPVSMIKSVDLLRDQTVMSILARVSVESKALKEFKKQIWQDIQTFLELSAHEHGVRFGGKKGNISLKSYDGRYKLVIAVNDTLAFNEKLQVAKHIIDECISRWVQGSSDEIRVLVHDAFNVDKAGNISTSKVLGLRRLNIQDEEWQKAMSAITDSITLTLSKTYMRFYARKENGEYDPITLDIASL